MGRVVKNTRYLDNGIVKLFVEEYDLIFCMPVETYDKQPSEEERRVKPYRELSDTTFIVAVKELKDCYVVDRKLDKIWWPAISGFLNKNQLYYRAHTEKVKNITKSYGFRKRMEEKKKRKKKKRKRKFPVDRKKIKDFTDEERKAYYLKRYYIRKSKRKKKPGPPKKTFKDYTQEEKRAYHRKRYRIRKRKKKKEEKERKLQQRNNKRKD